MKKVIIIFSTTLLLAANSKVGNAQTGYRPALQKGSISIDGSMAMSFGNLTSSYESQGYNGNEKYGYNTFSFSPQFSGFVVNGFALGVILDLTQISQKYDVTNSKSTSIQFTMGPSLKYYIPGGFFVSSNISFGKAAYKYSNDPDPDDGDKISKWQLGCGYAIFLNDHVSIEPGLLYRSTMYKNSDTNFKSTDKLNELVINVGLNIFIHKNGD